MDADHFVPSRPENLSLGWLPLDKDPVGTVQSGETVRMDTLTHAGCIQDEHPTTYLGGLGVPRDEILEDVLDFWASRGDRERQGRYGHVVTGPVYVENAQPGDVLEVRMLELEPRVPWGVNTTSPTSGILSPDHPGAPPDDPTPFLAERTHHLVRTGEAGKGARTRRVAFFDPGIQVPLAPFMGVLAVAPAEPTVGEPGVTVPGIQSSRPPGPYGGNLDLKDLVLGSSLYLPVFHPGALFYAGDPHGAQGDGEVSGTALEQSLTAVFRMVVHKGASRSGAARRSTPSKSAIPSSSGLSDPRASSLSSLTVPRAETETHHLLLGMDVDLDRALWKANRAVVEFLTTEKGLTPDQALSLASLAVDFRVAEAVNLVQLVVGSISKELFVGAHDPNP